MTILLRRLTFALLVAILAIGPFAMPVRADDWRPEKITVLLGHVPGGTVGRATEALAKVWSVKLGTPVVVVARGRASMLRAAGEFVLSPRDGRVVLAGDLGPLALAYTRARPSWTWARTLEHAGIYAVDPAVLFTSSSSGIDDLGDVLQQSRAQPYPVVIAAWDSLENVVLQDAAQVAGLRFAVTAAGGGPGLFDAVSKGTVRLAFGRLSLLQENRRAVRLFAHAGALGHEVAGGSATLDAALGVPSAPAGGFAAITVHAGLQRNFPERFERLKRSLRAARTDPNYLEALEELGLTTEGAAGIEHEEILAAVREWWDSAARVASIIGNVPPPVQTRGKLLQVEDEGRRLRYLGLDGKTHDLAADPEDTEITIAGVVPAMADPLMALKAGMLCEISRPSTLAVQASRLACR